MQDIYADDLVFLAGLGDRTYAFFASWIHGNVSRRGSNRWSNLGLCVSNGFALGSLARRGLLPKNDPLWAGARALDSGAGFEAVDSFAGLYESLPRDPTPDAFVARVRALANLMHRAGDGV